MRQGSCCWGSSASCQCQDQDTYPGALVGAASPPVQDDAVWPITALLGVSSIKWGGKMLQSRPGPQELTHPAQLATHLGKQVLELMRQDFFCLTSRKKRSQAQGGASGWPARLCTQVIQGSPVGPMASDCLTNCHGE